MTSLPSLYSDSIDAQTHGELLMQSRPLIFALCTAFVCVEMVCASSEPAIFDESRYDKYVENHQYKAAEKLLKDALMRDPNDLNLNFGLLNMYESQVNLSKSIEQAERCLSLSPGLIGNYRSLWQLYSVANRHSDAKKIVLLELEKIPLVSSLNESSRKRCYRIANLELSYSLHMMGREAEALVLLKSSVSESDADLMSLQAYAILMLQERKLEEASVVCQKCMLMSPDDNLSKLLMASSYLLTARYTKSIELFEQILEEHDAYAKEARMGLKMCRDAVKNRLDNNLFEHVVKQVVPNPLSRSKPIWPNIQRIYVTREIRN